MGRAIYYCFQCSKRVSDNDLDSGTAFRIGERILCIACAPPGTKPTSSKRIPVAPPRKSDSSSGAMRTSRPVAAPPPPPPAEDGRKRLFLIGGIVAAVVVVIAGILLTRKGAPPPTVLPDQTPTVKGPDAPVVPPRSATPPIKPADAKEASARADLEKARNFAKSRPEDLSAQMREYTDVVWKWDGTEAAREAARESAAVKAAILAKVSAWMADLEVQIKGLLEAKQYGAAERKIEELKKAHDLPEWRLAAEKRASEIFVMGKRAGEGDSGRKPEGNPPDNKPAARRRPRRPGISGEVGTRPPGRRPGISAARPRSSNPRGRRSRSPR
jgi:hypothetical protein